MKITSQFLLFLVGSLLWAGCRADCIITPGGTDAGNCTSASPCGTIRYCLTVYEGEADVSISLSSGTYPSDGNCGILIDSTSGITNFVVQALPNSTVTIDCDNVATHFSFQTVAATFTINGINLLRGDSGGNIYGGCLSASGVTSLSVQNVGFYNCTAYNGGALYTDSLTSILDSKFVNNLASSAGGAVYIDVDQQNKSIVTISKSVLTNNVATAQGGAIYLSGDYVSITDCNVTANTANEGGAVFLTTERPNYKGNYNFLGTTVSNNTATLGGGLYNDNLNHTFNVFGALFTSNIVVTKVSATEDPNIYCADANSTFCYSCSASDCKTGCGASVNQSCTLNAAAKAFCYTTKFKTCSGNSCKCSASTPLPTSAKILIALIAACMIIGIALIAIDVIRHLRSRNKTNGYTPIS